VQVLDKGRLQGHFSSDELGGHFELTPSAAHVQGVSANFGDTDYKLTLQPAPHLPCIGHPRNKYLQGGGAAHPGRAASSPHFKEEDYKNQ
jgi:hypothetical protein